MSTPRIGVCFAAAWFVVAATVVSAACLRLKDLGPSCAHDPPTAPECVVSTSVDLKVYGYEDGSPGSDKVNCAYATTCVQIRGKIDGSGACVGAVNYSHQEMTCALTGNPC